jgi:hypothetical protein
MAEAAAYSAIGGTLYASTYEQPEPARGASAGGPPPVYHAGPDAVAVFVGTTDAAEEAPLHERAGGFYSSFSADRPRAAFHSSVSSYSRLPGVEGVASVEEATAEREGLAEEVSGFGAFRDAEDD